MISVCIPVYNTDVRQLALSLNTQALDISAEIILVDDGSCQEYREVNRELRGQGIHYYELEHNVGRARIRNRFTKHARYDHLLFLDCDSRIISDYFLSNYFEAMRDFPEKVICGGRIYSNEKPGLKYRLHWKYGRLRESRPVSIRRRHANRSFMTNNFLIPAHTLRSIPFNEKISGYGHEDSLFGYDLYRKGYETHHIDNPVLHDRLETNAAFLAKTEQAVRNLSIITSQIEPSPVFAATITLLRVADEIKQKGRAQGLMISHWILRPLIRVLLTAGLNSLKLLDFHKLCTYLWHDWRNTRLKTRD
jgi:glycosyltransferase involved in cell wall biosynthesis